MTWTWTAEVDLRASFEEGLFLFYFIIIDNQQEHAS